MESSWGQQQGFKIKPKSLLAGLGIASLSSLAAVMAVMNPTQGAYEAYATQKVVAILDRNVCTEAPKAFNLRRDCKSLLTNNRSQIKQFIANHTEHQNFIFFSVYKTDVEIATFLPSYRVETVGAFQRFHLYESVRNEEME